jgi:hypothetical protein
MPVDVLLMRGVGMAVMNGSIKIPGPPATVTGVHGRVLGVDAFLLLGLNEHEHRRRRSARLTAICDRDCLRLLSHLPHGEAVRVADLTDLERRALRRLPQGVAEIAGRRVTRLAIPPVTIKLAIVVDDVLDRGLDSASRFAPFAPRLLVLTRPPDDLACAQVEARFYGIGLAMARADGVVTVADPEPAKRSDGPVTWRVREEAYAALLTAVGACA